MTLALAEAFWQFLGLEILFFLCVAILEDRQLISSPTKVYIGYNDEVKQKMLMRNFFGEKNLGTNTKPMAPHMGL